MNYKDIPPGKNPPFEVYAITEIGKGEGNLKYELDRKSGAMIIDRIRDSAMLYPINYGCIPQTLSEDGDPLDILVYCENSFQTGSIISARPVGVLLMDDQKGHDVKIIAVPADSVTEAYRHIQKVSDIPENERRKIEHFFKHYKDLEQAAGNWSTTSGWKDADVAARYIQEAIDRAKKPEPVVVVRPRPPGL